MKTVQGNQRFHVLQKVTIKMDGEEIQTFTYVLIFNESIIPKEVKIGYYLERVGQYIPHIVEVLQMP